MFIEPSEYQGILHVTGCGSDHNILAVSRCPRGMRPFFVKRSRGHGNRHRAIVALFALT